MIIAWSPLILAGLALTYSSLAPFLVADRRGLRSTPAATLVLWQALALGGVIAAVGAGVTAAVLWSSTDVGLPARAAALLGAGMAALVIARLLISGHRVGTRLRSVRARHRQLLDLLAHAEPTAGGIDVRVVESAIPSAYCLPAFRQSRIVLATGTLRSLEPDELRAVLAHEQAHLNARHDLVVEAFTVLDQAFPRALAGSKAQAEVAVLIEVLADREAVRRVGARPLVSALSQLSGTVPEAALGPSASGVTERLDCLTAPTQRLQSAIIVTTALVVLVAPVLLVAATFG